jgi:AraC-like DNA-binding protein|tara:strand:- start:350 stop:1273 length:924 start_codon:yes stop_codon:yes gene_type:complete
VQEELHIDPTYDGFLYLAESMRNPPVLQPHHHAELELNLVARGEITYIVGDKRYTFGPRTLLWMFPDQEHQLVDRSSDARYYVAVFKPDLIHRACRSAPYESLKAASKDPTVTHCKLEATIFDLLSRSMDELMIDGPDPNTLNREAGFGAASDFHYQHTDPDWLNAGLRHLLLLSWRYQRGQPPKQHEVSLHPSVAQALNLLGQPDAPENLDTLAIQCGVSSSYLSRMFRKQIGVPVTRYRNSVRLARFWEEYRQPEQRTLLEAMFAAGFGSYAQFYRVYSDVYGCGPRASLRTGSEPNPALTPTNS